MKAPAASWDREGRGNAQHETTNDALFRLDHLAGLADRLKLGRPRADAHLDKHRRLKRHALHIVLDAIAVFPRRESGCRPLAGVDPKTRALDVLVIDDPLAVAGRDVVAARVVRNFDDFPEELVRLLLARARTGRESASRPSSLRIAIVLRDRPCRGWEPKLSWLAWGNTPSGIL